MMRESAAKMAVHMVAEYGHAGHFELELLDNTEMDTMAEAFLKLGCSVDRIPGRRWLVISCDNDSIA